MFLIKTRVGPSSIHGTGVFAVDSIAAGAVVWRYDPVFDRTFSEAEFETAAPSVQAFLQEYAYRAADLEGSWVLSGDHARFLNHSAAPNTIEAPYVSIAARDIEAGDEITTDYGAFCLNWTSADFGHDVVTQAPLPHHFGHDVVTQAPLPHTHLHTRIRPAQHGVGVFALHDIGLGVPLFEGDNGATVRVPVSVVQAIDDAAVRQMYFDFCPQDGAFLVSPADFNQLTMGWHLNHSDTPNVVVGSDLRFRTAKVIKAGEELTSDYRSYSASARRLIPTWRGSCEGPERA